MALETELINFKKFWTWLAIPKPHDTLMEFTQFIITKSIASFQIYIQLEIHIKYNIFSLEIYVNSPIYAILYISPAK